MASHVAAILDTAGGLRVVVTKRRADFRQHCRPRERLLIVPGLRVREPVAWDEVPAVIAQASAYVAEWIRGRNDPDALKHPAVIAYRKRRGL